MPSKLPRLNLTLPLHVHAAVFDLADAMGKPASKVVTEILEDALPQLQSLAKIARAAKAGNNAAAKRALVHMLGDNAAELVALSQPELFPPAKPKAKRSK